MGKRNLSAKRPRRGLAVGVTCVVALSLLAGYGVADAYDVVPGLLTMRPEKKIIPYPVAPGAVEPGAPSSVAGASGAQAPVPDPAALAAVIDPLLADARLGAGVSLEVVDELTGRVLYDKNGAIPRTPASTLKILSAVAALEELGPNHTLKTRVFSGEESGAITLVGGGDMMLSATQGDQAAVNGRAGLGDLAAATAAKLQAEGTSAVTLEVDNSYFSGPQLAPTLSADNVASMIYVAPVTAMAMDIGKINTNEEYSKRQADPAAEAVKAFTARLAEHGISVTNSAAVTVEGDSPNKYSEDRELASVSSAPLSEIVAFFLEHSDNTITEVAGRLVAIAQGLPGSFAGASQAVPATLQKLGIDTTGLHMADCSGLSDGSTLTANILTKSIGVAANTEHPKLRTAITGLPIAGLSGTLTSRITSPGVAGMVRAKTGSLPRTSSLAGIVVDADGRVLNFAFISNDGAESSKVTQPAIDAVVTAIQGCGC